MNPKRTFQYLENKFTNEPDVTRGQMMSSPGLKYRNKVFAFYHKEKMGFRLGPHFDANKMGINNAKPLSPFKTKPPLKGWFMISKDQDDLWEPLTEMALEFTKTLK